MSTQNQRLGAAVRLDCPHANQSGATDQVPCLAGERPVSSCLKTPGPALGTCKIRFRRIECVNIPASKNADDYKNLHSRFRRFRNRLIMGNPLDAASGLCRSHKGKFDFVYIDLYSPDHRRGFPSRELSALLPLSRELLGECGNICLRCNLAAQRKTRRATDAIFGTNHHIATTARSRRIGDCFIIYRKTDVHICNRHVEPLQKDAYNQLSTRLENIIKTWSSDDSLVAGFFLDASETVAAPENAGRRWIVAAGQARSMQTARKHLIEAQSAHHACGRAFRPFDIYAMA